MALSEFDRNLLQRCLSREPRSWENFVDRFLGLVLHVVNHTAQSRSVRLSEQDREILLMFNFEGLTSQETGLILGIEAATARKRHGRALIRLRKCLLNLGYQEM